MLISEFIQQLQDLCDNEGDMVIYKDNNTERRGVIAWDSKAAAFCFGQDFLVHYPSENMVIVGNELDK